MKQHRMPVFNNYQTIMIPPCGKNTIQIVNAYFGNASDTATYVGNYCFKNDHVGYDYCILHESTENIEHKFNKRFIEIQQTIEFEADIQNMRKFIFYFKKKQRRNFKDKLLSTEILILINFIIVFFEKKYLQSCPVVDNAE